MREITIGLLTLAAMFSVTANWAANRPKYVDEMGNDVDCHYCTVYTPVGEQAVQTLEQARNEASYYARCERNLYPGWLFHRIRELEAKQ